ncbi:hypothetical protein ACFXG7_37025 [Nocardia tengchongensis]|uniref:hypothetical protein n=1 Tax=Nocardia tengchongensis TaxID=2055889 RepID=UPI0036D171DC
MTALMGSTAHELLAQVLARYGSIDAFIARLHVLLDTPTVERPVAVDRFSTLALSDMHGWHEPRVPGHGRSWKSPN